MSEDSTYVRGCSHKVSSAGVPSNVLASRLVKSRSSDLIKSGRPRKDDSINIGPPLDDGPIRWKPSARRI